MIAEQKELLSDMGREDNCSRTVTADKSLEISRGGVFLMEEIIYTAYFRYAAHG